MFVLACVGKRVSLLGEKCQKTQYRISLWYLLIEVPRYFAKEMFQVVGEYWFLAQVSHAQSLTHGQMPANSMT